MLVDGRAEVTGMRRDDVFAKTARQRKGRSRPVPRRRRGLVVRFLGSLVTAVRSDENKGKTLTNTHVVREIRAARDWRGRRVALDVPDAAPADGEGCEVLVQAVPHGPIHGTAACPSTSAG